MTRGPEDPAIPLTRFLATEAPESVAVVYLFGGHAEGRAHRDSDVDLGVVLRYDRSASAAARFEEGVRLAPRLTDTLGGMAVDLVVLNDAPPGLAARVATRGRVLYCADADAEHAFRRDAQLRAADLEPFLRRTRGIKLEALGR